MMSKQASMNDSALTAARMVAQQVVRERFPDLDGVEPQVSLRTPHLLALNDARRLGVADLPAHTPSAIEYIFTFARELHTPEGYCMPHVARVTVDAKQRVVKAVHSK